MEVACVCGLARRKVIHIPSKCCDERQAAEAHSQGPEFEDRNSIGGGVALPDYGGSATSTYTKLVQLTGAIREQKGEKLSSGTCMPGVGVKPTNRRVLA